MIRVNEFNKLATDYLEEWIRYLKDEYINPDTNAPGLKEAKERLEYLRMSPEQQHAYDHYLDTLVRDTDVLKTQLLEAKLEGRAEGRAEGEQGKAIAIAKKLKDMEMPVNDIAEATGLTAEKIIEL